MTSERRPPGAGSAIALKPLPCGGKSRKIYIGKHHKERFGMKKILILAAAAAAAGAWGAAKDPALAYSDAVQDIVAKYNAKLVDIQPLLVWPGDNLDQDARDKIAWKLEVGIEELSRIQAELTALAVPEGFMDAHKMIASSFDLYAVALSRCGTGIQLGYVKTFNGGVQDYNNAGNYLQSGMDELAAALGRAGYSVN
jgi:hypothetical protein